MYDFIPTSLFYNENVGLDELSLKMKEDIQHLSILKNFIDSIMAQKQYDFIIIDCPPTNNLITQSAFLLSDYYIIPTILDLVSSNGVAHYISTVNNTYKKYCTDNEDSILYKYIFDSPPKLLGIFYNLVRGQVNYDEAKQNLVDTIKHKINKDIKIYGDYVNNLYRYFKKYRTWKNIVL